jgi:hypothetical protein
VCDSQQAVEIRSGGLTGTDTDGTRRAESRYAGTMTIGWRFIGEIWSAHKRSMVLECVIPIADRKEAEAIARQRLAGADSITAIEMLQHGSSHEQAPRP